MDLHFIGENGSMGFRFGQIYRLALQPNEKGITIVHPRRCPYASQEAFWRNWAHPREDLRTLMEARGQALRELYFVREFETAPTQQCTRKEIHGSHNWTSTTAPEPVLWCPGKTQ